MQLIAGREPLATPGTYRLVAAALHHNVTGYVVRAMNAGELELPGFTAEHVVDWDRSAVLRTALLRRELSSIATPLERACDAAPLLIKGPAVTDRFYPDWRLRPSIDLDLLVPLARLQTARRALEALDYEDVEEFRPGYAERHGHDVHLRRRVGEGWWVDVELHWRVGDDPAGAALSHDRLGPAAERLDIDGTELAVPSAPAQLLVLAIHLLSDRTKRLAWINDLRLVGQALGPEQWEQAFAEAQSCGLLWPLHRALDYAQRSFGWERPRPLPPGPPLPWGPLRAVEELNMRAAPHLGRLAALGWRDRLSFLRAVLVPTRRGLRGTVGQDDDATTWRLIRRHARKAWEGLGPRIPR